MTPGRLKIAIQRLIRDETRHYSRAEYLKFIQWLASEACAREKAVYEDDLAQLEDRL